MSMMKNILILGVLIIAFIYFFNIDVSSITGFFTQIVDCPQLNTPYTDKKYISSGWKSGDWEYYPEGWGDVEWCELGQHEGENPNLRYCAGKYGFLVRKQLMNDDGTFGKKIYKRVINVYTAEGEFVETKCLPN